MGPIKEVCFFPFSVFFFLHLVYFFLMDRKVRTNWSNWRDVQPFFLPRSIFNACCIERSNPLKSFRTFNNFLEAHVNIIWSKRVHLSICFRYNMHLKFTFQKKHARPKCQKKSEPLFTSASSLNCIAWLQSNTLYPSHSTSKGKGINGFDLCHMFVLSDSRYEKRWVSIGEPISGSARGYKKTTTRTNATE